MWRLAYVTHYFMISSENIMSGVVRVLPATLSLKFACVIAV